MNTPVSNRAAPVRAWWEQREPRERAMLAVMLVATAAFAWWYGALVPLRQARDAAQAGHAQAAAKWTRVQHQVVELVALESRTPARPVEDGALRQALREAAERAGLDVELDARAAAGRIEIRGDAVAPAALFGWLDHLRSRHGLAPDTLSVAKSGNGLRVHATFRSGT